MSAETHDPMLLPYESLRHLSEMAVRFAIEEWREKHPGREPAEADLDAIALAANAELEAAMPGFAAALAKQKFAAFVMAEFRAWQSAHTGETEPPDDVKRRMATMALLRLRAGHEPGSMT
jgi:hypothetical protein